MSRLLIVTRPELAAGFHLAGVDAYAVEDVESAQTLISAWLEGGETGLLAIDDSLLAGMEPAFVNRLNTARQLPHIAIPGGESLGSEASWQHQISEMIRYAIGFHITFKGLDDEGRK
jgi:vacuolar-type H+-ATPase subunit F/Vma7